MIVVVIFELELVKRTSLFDDTWHLSDINVVLTSINFNLLYDRNKMAGTCLENIHNK